MIDKKLFKNIMQTHKPKIGNYLYYFLFSDCIPIIVNNNEIILSLDDFTLDFIKPGSKNFNLFLETIQEVLFSDDIKLSFVLFEEKLQSELSNDSLFDTTPLNEDTNLSKINTYIEPSNEPIELVSNYTYDFTNLSPNLTFKNFFYSYENKQIIDGSKLIIDSLENPTINPLFIYGKSGIGKTHILNAIGNEMFAKLPNTKILYLHSQTFIEEYTSLFKGGLDNTNKIDEFKKKYDEIDVLLLDDIQHLESKTGSINEFFGIFEKMRNNQKIVIIASDKEPKKINFDNRLISRFLSGLTLEMKIPDQDTKKEIFYYHARNRKIKIEDAAVDIFIKYASNVRALIGYLNSITLYLISNDYENQKIDTNDANVILKISNNEKKLTEEDITKIVASHYKIRISDIRGKKRQKEIVSARHFLAYFLRIKLNKGYEQIAYSLGFSDHTAAMNAYKSAQKKILDPKHQEDFKKLENLLLD